jgi:signal transduction histidine kinase
VADAPEGGARAGAPALGGEGADGAGRGLAGMRERVELFGGTLQAEPTPEGGFLVRADLPVPP